MRAEGVGGGTVNRCYVQFTPVSSHKKGHPQVTLSGRSVSSHESFVQNGGAVQVVLTARFDDFIRRCACRSGFGREGGLQAVQGVTCRGDGAEVGGEASERHGGEGSSYNESFDGFHGQIPSQ